MSDDARGAAATGDENDIYHMFMGLLALLSIISMLILYLLRIFWPDSPVISILWGADSLFCIFFLFDFARSLIRAPVKREYLLWQGVLDLLSSIPAFPALRIARVARIGRVARMVRGRGARSIAHEFIERRAESALYVTGLGAILLLVIGSSLAVTFENHNADANITTGGNSFWWAFVTITTVGYGDYFPVTRGGRIVGMIMMTFGIGIFGVLTSFMSSIFLAPKKQDELDDQSREDTQRLEMEALRRELAEIKQLLQERTPA